MTHASISPRLLATAWLGIVVAVLAPAVVTVAGPGVAALAAVLAFAAAGAGPGVMCWIDAGDGYAQAGLVLVTSLAAFAFGATVLLWLGAWTPALLWALGAASALSCVIRLAAARRGSSS
jgi:hypothetical protein